MGTTRHPTRPYPGVTRTRGPWPWVWVSAGPQPARSPGLSSSTKPDSPSFHQSTSRLPNPSLAPYDAPERCNAQC
ncbi:hypothetical protein LshimejAT787_3700100 [Lyophyllum shimeji]|uniref:Uncharacterized protein n=1 Tax=Lyophyllum shimeji TaxID=47721 RepID=A0A9P3PZE3_LYOSH|nr:hypothetical protein LshimejAT787_3700100 [Lyophyllum shimeji]